ncbi:MAG: sarcosine oxidase subunit gamma [Sulfitobacter sp.]|jgi:sarcosine oxidase, subunit gamma
MSEPVTALKNASATNGIAEIREIGPLGMITLRGDLSAGYLKTLATKQTGVEFPAQRTCKTDGLNGLAWMSPDELLMMCPYGDAQTSVARMTEALSGKHALVANVSDARAVFEVKGPLARDVMAKLAPVDLAIDRFSPGMFRRSRLAQVPAAFWMPDAETFQIVCFRSVARYMFDLLSIAAQPGSEVGHF